jgi:hypothetical protein
MGLGDDHLFITALARLYRAQEASALASEPVAAPEPTPEPQPAPEQAVPVALNHGPAGPTFEAAAAEPNWYVCALVREPGKAKLRKIPINAAGHYVDTKIAASLSLVQALQRRDQLAAIGPPKAIGYLPRPGSIMIAADLDDCLLPWEDDQEPATAIARQVLTETHGYAERSVSGTGVRLLMKRDPQTPRVTVEHAGAGLFATDAHGFVITFDPLPGRSRDVISNGRVGYLIMEHIRLARHAAAHAARDRSNGPREQSGFHFFDQLDPDQQLAELPKLLAALPEGAFAERGTGTEPVQWISIAMAVKHHFDEDAWPAFDEWSRDRAGGNYDEGNNRRIWDSLKDTNGDGRARSIGSLIWLARQHGYKPPPGSTRPPASKLPREELDQLAAMIRRHHGLEPDHG